MKKKIIFVHGFGVKKDARGIFTDIEKSFLNDGNFKNVECIFTDLNIILENGDLFLNPIEMQISILQKVYEQEKENSEIYIIAHSQGCVITSLCDFQNLQKVFFLAPPTNNDLDKTIERMKKRPGTIINLDSESIVVRADGSKTIIPASYWQSRKKINYLDCYKNFSEKIGKDKLKIILANQDEIVENGEITILELEKFGEIIKVEGDHNFTQSRNELGKRIKENF